VPEKPEKKYVRATTGFMLHDNTIVKAGQIVATTDRVVKGREEFFEPMEEYVETATRAPGERRLTPRRGDVVVMSAAKRRRGRRASTPPADGGDTTGSQDADTDDGDTGADAGAGD
jgi:hypothetical protein